MKKNRKHLIVIVSILIAGAGAGASVGAFIALTHDLPQIRELQSFKPSAVTRIYSRDNHLLSELYQERRDPVPLDAIPDYLKKALVTTEDRKFYSHGGVDVKGIVRALIKDIMAGGYVEGASTITQQLAKTLFLTPKKTIKRKIREAFLAFQLERRYTKNEILELYLNQIYLGSGAYGVASAAKTFFGKPLEKLDLSECALVAAMPKAPSRFSPLVNPELAVERRNIVLKQMILTGIITKEQYETAVNTPLTLAEKKARSFRASYFVDYVKRFLENEETIGSSSLYKGGLSIHTTLSSTLQKAAETAMADGLAALEKRMKKRKMNDPSPQGALIALDVSSGGILAMVGGRDFTESPFNRAVSARRQPGSSFKPILYANAIERGFGQHQTLLDAPVVFKGADNGKDWRPENYYKNYRGEMSMREALAHSRNIPAVRLMEKLGPESVVEFGRALGVESTLRPNLSLALGSSTVSLIELASAYSVFANKGNRIKPFAILKVVNAKGQVIWKARSEKAVAMSRVGAAIITDMLQGVIQDGTGKKARTLRGPLAGKTGTTNQCRDALFIGYSPDVVAGVWVGRDNYKSLGSKETGAAAALPIWIEFMRGALSERSVSYFDIPDGVVRAPMDPVSGKPLPEGDSRAVAALFKKGSEPGE